VLASHEFSSRTDRLDRCEGRLPIGWNWTLLFSQTLRKDEFAIEAPQNSVAGQKFEFSDPRSAGLEPENQDQIQT
jgi:hypothetical protein